MARKRKKGRSSITRHSQGEYCEVAHATQEDLEAAALLSGGLVCPPRLSQSADKQTWTQSKTRQSQASSLENKQTLQEKDAMQLTSYSLKTVSFEAQLSTNTSIEQKEVLDAPARSALICVTPDTDKTKKEERQKRPLDMDCSVESVPVKSSGNDPTKTSILQEGLDILSSVFLISSNALIDQIKYLPDSVVPPADYSYDEHDEGNMDEQVETLKREFGHLLWDRETQRATFIALPKDVLQLLRGVWNLSEDPSLTDRVGKRLVPVQSFFPNLLNYLLRTPGFPTASDVFDSDIFRAAGRKKVKAIESAFKDFLRDTMESMGYPCAGQDIEFYLSFMRTTRRTIVQDPHIDFRFQTVDPWYVDESPALRRRTGRGKRLGYKERVPFIAFFPLTPDGMAVEVWEARDDHRSGRPGVLVHIPYGCMMIARGDLVHAGGFSNSSQGNPRCHLYIYRSGGEVHDINTSNSYTMEVDGKMMRMSQLYQHGPGI